MFKKTALLAEDGFPNDRICQDPNNFHTGFLNFSKIEYVEYSYFFSFSAFLKCLQSCSLSGCDQGVMEDLLFLSAKTPHNAPTWPDQTPEKTSEISKERFAFGFSAFSKTDSRTNCTDLIRSFGICDFSLWAFLEITGCEETLFYFGFKCLALRVFMCIFCP